MVSFCLKFMVEMLRHSMYNIFINEKTSFGGI